MATKSEEVNYKKNFCEKFFDKDSWDLDVLNRVDVFLHRKNKKKEPLLYIETKFSITNESEHRKALAQTILTNKKQDNILPQVALVYQDSKKENVLELIDCSEDSVMFNNDINWDQETPSNPSRDAIDGINNRLKGKITRYTNDEIKDFYENLKKGDSTEIQITEKNFISVYNQWKSEISFKKKIENEQELINLFLVDILNGTTYKQKVAKQEQDNSLLLHDELPLIREGTNLSKYELISENSKVRIIYDECEVFTIVDKEKYDFFWKKYHRPPCYEEFLKIIEHSAKLYTEQYRKDTGGEYTPVCFVELQNELLKKYNYNMDEYIVFDPCAGVGNLENQFGKDYKQYCYLSTLEQMDVDTCKIKGFENVIKFDYLKDDKQPKWKFGGTELSIDEICKREKRKLMVVMNPPYKNTKGKKNNLAIEFFNKVLTLQPQVIVFYYTTKSFFGSEVQHYIRSEYKIVSHIFSNAKTTFKLKTWPISQVIFDKEKGELLEKKKIHTQRYELEKDNFAFKGNYTYNFEKPNLFLNLKKIIKNNQTGMKFGNYSYLNDIIKIGNGGENRGDHVTTGNLKYCLISKGLIFNSHHKYFELNSIVYRGSVDDIGEELQTDAIMFSLFYKGFLFTNKGQKNYLMPFSAEDLGHGCERNDLNILYPENIDSQDLFTPSENPFDFREYLKQFVFSAEAKNLYNAALQIFKFYHESDDYVSDRNWNDSYYDITNAIMQKDPSSYSDLDSKNDRRIAKVKTTKGTSGFSRVTIKNVIKSEFIPLFEHFFNSRDMLAKKINRQLVEQGILLWERENIY